LQEYNSPEEYITQVQKYIRWKRAKAVATRELYEHISDQYEAFLDDGFDKQTAMKKAIQEMGGADIVGAELDSVHRPKTNWLLLALTVLLLAIGMIVSFMLLPSTATLPKILGIAFGLAAAVFLYFTAYTILIRYPKPLYNILSILTVLMLLWEIRNGFAILSYSYTFYLLLCYPLALVGILFQLKNSDSDIKIILYGLYSCFPLILALLDKSFTAFIIILISAIFLLLYGLKLKWIKWSKVNFIGMICILAVLALFTLFMERHYDLVTHSLLIETSSFYQLDLFSALPNAAFTGPSSTIIDKQIMSHLYDHPICLLLYNYGILSVVLLFMIFSLLFYLLYKTIKNQNTEIGKLLASIILMLFLIKITGTCLYELGILPGFHTGFPFVTTGGAFIVYDLALIGIMLSISRNESIAKDWIRLKEKGRIINE